MRYAPLRLNKTILKDFIQTYLTPYPVFICDKTTDHQNLYATMKDICDATGGEIFECQTGNDIEKAFQKIYGFYDCETPNERSEAFDRNRNRIYQSGIKYIIILADENLRNEIDDHTRSSSLYLPIAEIYDECRTASEKGLIESIKNRIRQKTA